MVGLGGRFPRTLAMSEPRSRTEVRLTGPPFAWSDEPLACRRREPPPGNVRASDCRFERLGARPKPASRHPKNPMLFTTNEAPDGEKADTDKMLYH